MFENFTRNTSELDTKALIFKYCSTQIFSNCNFNNSRILLIMGTYWQQSTEHQSE